MKTVLRTRRAAAVSYCAQLLIVGAFALAGASATTAANDAPELYVSLRGVADGSIEAGEPLHVVVQIEAPEGSAGTWLLAPAAGTWADAVSVAIVGADGTARASGSAVGQPDEPAATIDADRLAAGLWRIPAQQTLTLVPGAYSLRASLTLRDGTGWKGTAQADEQPLTVIAPGSPGRAGLKTLAIARDALLTGDAESAAKLLDAELERDPLQYRALLLRARIAEQAGNLLATSRLLELAQHSVAGTGAGYPNVEFEELSARVHAGLLNPLPGTPSEPPAWSWPPMSVMRALADRADLAQRPDTPQAAGETPPAPPAASAIAPAAETAATAEHSAAGIAALPPSSAPAPAAQRGGEPANGPRAWIGDQAVPADPNAQWAVSAQAGSQYGSDERSAMRATGAPDVPGADDHPNAWCPAVRDSGSDWLELSFARAEKATEVRVRQSYGPGAIVKVEAIEPGGQTHVWWEGVDPFGQDGMAADGVWFSVRVPTTDYAVQKIRLSLNLAAHGRWKQIDAVQLIGEGAR